MNDDTKLVFEKFAKALRQVEQALKSPMCEEGLAIDGTIKRFEFTFELAWKLLKKILLDKHGVIVASPKKTLQQAYANHLIDDEQVWLSMLDDRNLTVHTYNEDLAREIYERIKLYVPVFVKLQDKVKKN